MPNPANRVATQTFAAPARHDSQRPHGSAGSADDPFAGSRTVEDHPGELMAQDERPVQAGVTDAPLAIPVQVRPAQADRRDPDGDLAGPRAGDGLR